MIISGLTKFTYKQLFLWAIILPTFNVYSNETQPSFTNPQFTFTENKGQVSDQNNNPRTDILFYGKEGALTFHLKNNGISYQQYRVDEWKEEKNPVTEKLGKFAAKTTIYRIDMNWLNADQNARISPIKTSPGFSNYYSAVAPNGVLNVQSHEELIYNNIYEGINMRWYYKNQHLKYDYVVAPGADHTNIQVQIKGASKLSINLLGELEIETPLGKIIEEAPYVTQNKKQLTSRWMINGDVVSFKIDQVDPLQELIIDPGVRLWGTYYGGNGGDSGLNIVTDASGNIYVCGTTNSTNGNSIATAGSHQSVYGGGVDNGWVAKFNSAGVRQWSTYYGGTVREFGFCCAVDNAGNVFLGGHSFGSPGTAVATIGSHQPSFGGAVDGYLVKFNNSGVRQWGTFYGGSGTDNVNAVITDASGNVYITGRTEGEAGNVIATASSHQPTFGGVDDAYLAKFNPAGVRQWATYYGGNGTDMGRGLNIDATGNIYMVGWTDNSAPNIIATPGTHQTTFGGGSLDAFLVKFNQNGVRQWGTQYGGNGTDMAYDCEVDLSGNIYVCGKTSSTFSISSVGCHQPVFGGGPQDAFLASFNSVGLRNWATYYGGTGDEEAWGCAVHSTGHVYISGSTSSSGGTVIATPGSHLPAYGGGAWDAFIAQFDPSNNGSRMWGSYYGETGDDLCYGCTTDNALHVYIIGPTDTGTGTGIASPGSHQSTYGNGWGDGYFAKFYDCPAPIPPANSTPTANLIYCETPNTTTLTVTSGATINWYATATSTTSIGTGSVYITPVLSAGTHTFYADASSCTVSLVRTAVVVTVNPLPTMPVFANPTVVCSGKSTTLTVIGTDTYTWSTGDITNTTVATPSVTSIFTISATNTIGCVGSNTISITVYPLDVVTLTPEKNISCLTIFGGTPIALIGAPPGGTFSGPNVNSSGFLNPTALGTFNPVYTYSNSVTGCTNNASASIIVISCMGVQENMNTLQSVSVYPNPTKGLVFIESETELEKSISICDVTGKLVYTEKVKDKKHHLNLSEYSNGMYFLKITTTNGTREFKIMKD